MLGDDKYGGSMNYNILKSIIDKCYLQVIRILVITCKKYYQYVMGMLDDDRYTISKKRKLLGMDWELIKKFRRASYCNYKDIVEEIIKKNDIFSDVHVLDEGLAHACKGDHVELAKYFLKRGANDVNYALYYACMTGATRAIDFLEGEGVDHWDWAIEGFSRGGQLELLKDRLEKIDLNEFPYSLRNALYFSSRKGQMKVVEYLMTIKEYKERDIKFAIEEAERGGYEEVIKYLGEKIVD